MRTTRFAEYLLFLQFEVGSRTWPDLSKNENWYDEPLCQTRRATAKRKAGSLSKGTLTDVSNSADNA